MISMCDCVNSFQFRSSYKVSIALSINDLRRIDKNVFSVSPDIDKVCVCVSSCSVLLFACFNISSQLLSLHYNVGYGFVICVFNASMDAHPLAFVCDRNADGTLYIPTRHEHGQ
jgi:hypothetical protein